MATAAFQATLVLTFHAPVRRVFFRVLGDFSLRGRRFRCVLSDR